MASQITLDNFKEWNKNCRVRMVQKQFDQVIQRARDAGRSVEEEMKAEGFKDYTAFQKSCPEFSLTCRSEEFAELGSGFVLYFQFIRFLAVILVLVLCLQIPALAKYSNEDWTSGWWWHRWEDGWSNNDDACACKGASAGMTGPGFPEAYGTSCKAWDVDLCLTGNASSKYGSPGKWCCTSWCFADKKCQAPKDGKPQMRNVHVKGMVRATSSCIQDPIVIAKCSGMADEAYSEPDIDTVPSDAFIGKGWLTPGNFGPDQAEDGLIPFMFFVIVLAISIMTVCMSQHQIYMDAKVDAGTTSPNDFAILAKGLPATATDEGAIRKFFEENAVKDKGHTEIVKVVIGWDVEEYRVKIQEIRQLRNQLKELETDDPEYLNIRKQIAQVASDLAACAPDRASRLRSSGLVVVVFRYQADMRACLKRWASFWARWTYSDAEDTCCLPAGNGFWKRGSLPRFAMGDPPVPVSKVKVERAANPGDIHWEELGKSSKEKLWLLAKTNGIMIVLILVCFGFTYGLNYAQSHIKAEESKKKELGDSAAGFRVLSMVPGIGVSIVNMILMIAARRLGDKEFHETWTGQEFSQAAKMAAALIINTAGVLIFSNIQPKEWYESGGLIDDSLFILLLDALLPPFFFFLDMKYQITGLRVRRKLTQKRLDTWNDTIKQNSGSGKEMEAARNQVKAEVEGFKRVYEPSEMDNPRRYANALNTFFCALLLSPVFPLALLIGFVGLVWQYCIDRYMLLRWYKRPKRPYNPLLAQWSLKLVKFVAPLGLSLAFFCFLSPSWEDKGQVARPFLLSLIVSAIMVFVPTMLLRTLLGLRCFLSAQGFIESENGGEDYYQAQYTWSKEMKYHKDHFLYKCLPEAKNPEFLTPDVDSALNVDDLRGSYGAATAEAASTATSGDSAVALKGGRVLGGGTWGAGVEAAPAPVPAPAASAEEPVALVAPALVAPTPHPPAAPAAVPTPYAPSAAVRPVWEYETNHGFTAFNDDCQVFLEKKYQEFSRSGGRGEGRGKSKGSSHINVRTSGTSVSVDFEKMTSQIKDSHKKRAIRRREA